MKLWIFVFLSILVTDVAWSLYIRWTAQSRILLAATSSAAIYLLGFFALYEVLKDFMLLLPAALGAFLGTIIAILIDIGAKITHLTYHTEKHPLFLCRETYDFAQAVFYGIGFWRWYVGIVVTQLEVMKRDRRQ